VEGGVLRLTPKRHAFTVRGGARGLTGLFDEFRSTLGVRRYEHTEEALAPAVDQRSFAAFIFEAVSWPHVTVQFGGRVEHTGFEPVGEPTRAFTNVSGSLGLLLRPAAANDRLTIAASLARAARNPVLEELFEARFPGRELVGHHHHDADEGEHGEDGGHGHEGEESELPFVDFVGADAVLQGFEAHADFQLTARLFAEGGLDYVRGTLTSAGQPLPRMPPLRGRVGLRYQQNAFQAGGELVAATKQDRIAGAETATAGYTLLKLFASYSFTSGQALSTVTARLDNATREAVAAGRRAT
jgi:iron complex outermembrane receptor protein